MDKKIKIMLALTVIMVICAGFIVSQFINKSDFDPARIDIKLESPSSVSAGENFTIRILYANNNNIPLKNAALAFDKPDGFEFVQGGLGEYIKSIDTKLGAIEPGSTGEAKLKGTLVAPMDAAIKFKFHLKFTPGNLSADMEKMFETEIKISSVPITSSLDAPSTVINGYSMEYKVSIANQTASDFQKVAVFADYPKNFTFISADPPSVLGDNSVWNIEYLKGYEKRDLIIKGVLRGEKDEIIEIKSSAGIMSSKGFVKYSESKASSRLMLPSINLFEIVNDSVSYNANPGEELNMVIKYKNNSAHDFNDLRITGNLKGEVLDFGSLTVEDGIYDEIPDPQTAEEANLSWDSRILPALAVLGAAEEKEVRFKIKVKDKPPIKNVNSTNFVIKNLVKVYAKFADETEEKMITDNEFITKTSSKLILNAKAYYNDDGRIINKGPIPPSVGKQTTFTVHWQVLNLSNDARDVTVKAVMPLGVIWTGKIIPDDTVIKINWTGVYSELSWRVGDLPANAGIFSPVREIIFQVGVAPELKDVGDYKTLIGKTEITGIDNFTGVPLKTSRDEITTRLFDDISIGPEEGKVAP